MRRTHPKDRSLNLKDLSIGENILVQTPALLFILGGLFFFGLIGAIVGGFIGGGLAGLLLHLLKIRRR